MKKIYLSIIAVFAIITTANAQKKNVDIEIILKSPLVNATLPCTDSFLLSYMIINHGPDTLDIGDTLHFMDPSMHPDATAWYMDIASTINSGDSLDVYNSISHFQLTKSLFNLTNDTVLGAPFVNGNYNYFVLLDLDTSKYDDSNLANNIVLTQVVIACDLSANDLSKSTTLNVYPNPANTTINFSYDFVAAQNATARVYDLMGRTVLTQEFGKQAVGVNNFTIDIATLSNGVYYVELVSGNTRGMSKFTVSK